MQIVNGNKDRPEYISVEMNNNGQYHLYDPVDQFYVKSDHR